MRMAKSGFIKGADVPKKVKKNNKKFKKKAKKIKVTLDRKRMRVYITIHRRDTAVPESSGSGL